MNSDIFINIGFDTAIKRYLLLKNKKNLTFANNFLVYIICMLNFIYGEDNILNPYYNRKNNGYKVLLNNLKIYGLSEVNINKFFKDISSYIDVEVFNHNNNLEKNEFFTYLQEDLIDMFLSKASKLCYTKENYIQFRNLLFYSDCNNQNRRKINEKLAYNLDASINYFDYKMFEMTSTLTFISVKDNLFSDIVYKAFGIDKKALELVNQKTLNEINNKIYSYFNINPIETKANKKLEQASQRLINAKFKFASNSGQINVLIFIILFAILISSGIILGLYFIKNM